MRSFHQSKFYRSIAVLMWMVILITSIMCIPAEAGSRYVPKELRLYTSKKKVESYMYVYQDVPANYRITKVECTPKNIATVSLNSVNKSITITPRKVGEFTLKTTIHSKSKKTIKTYKTRVKVYKYVNPCKSFKINGKEMSTKLKNTSQSLYRYGDNRQLQINVKPKAGWDVTYRAYYHGRNSMVINSNASTIFADKDNGIIRIDFKNRKTKVVESILVYTTR